MRIEYVAKLDDGSEVARRTASFKVGRGSMCAAIEEGVCGMSVGDRRRLRAPPWMARGPAVQDAPAHEIIEYDIHLTGAVHHMRVVTLKPPEAEDPLQQVWDFGKNMLGSVLSTASTTFRRKP